MTSISGFIFVNEIDTGRKFGTRVNHTILEIKDIDGTYTVLLKLIPNHLKATYLLHDLDNVKSHEKKIVLKFLKPNHELLVMSDDEDKVISFLKDLKSLKKNLNLNIGEFCLVEALKSFGNFRNNCGVMQKFDLTRLRMIALENCYIPFLPEDIGHLKLSSFSLNGSRFNTSKYGKYSEDLRWNWMTKDNISTTLNVLEMNSIGISKFPFEIMYLRRLQTLTVSNNKLIHIPHFIGDLPELKTLIINDNWLWYFPDSLSDRVFQNINICNNRFMYLKTTLEPPNNDNLTGLRNAPNLLDMSLVSIINNCVKFKRQEIPRTLWTRFDFVRRCKLCKKQFVFDPTDQNFTFDFPKTERMVRIEKIHWQFFVCRPLCRRLENNNI